MFTELAPSACAALSLARLAIEPLLEYCSLWKGVDSSGTFGYEAMYLKLHPLQVSSSSAFLVGCGFAYIISFRHA